MGVALLIRLTGGFLVLKSLFINIHPQGFLAPIKGRDLVEQKKPGSNLTGVKKIIKVMNNPAWEKAGILYLLGEESGGRGKVVYSCAN